MTLEEIRFINRFQATVIDPIQKDLRSRKHKNWKNDKLSTTLEEILCSLSLIPQQNGEFDLAYLCREDIIHASYRLNSSIEHVEHSLWEVFIHLELYSLKPGLLPLGSELNHLKTRIDKLLRIINPHQYGKFTNSFM